MEGFNFSQRRDGIRNKHAEPGREKYIKSLKLESELDAIYENAIIWWLANTWDRKQLALKERVRQ